MNLGTLVVKLLLERAQFKTELAQTVQDVNTAATQVQGRTAAISGAVTDAVTGQTTAVQTATRALTVLGPVAATALAAVAAVGYATHQAHQETLGYEKAIILTGNAAGVTAGQLGDMAKRIDGVVGTQANAAAALTAMTAGGKVARENLEKVSLAAIEMERAVGQSISDTEKIFSSLGKEPVKASLRLNESLNYLTASTYAQIKAAENMGDTERAVSIAQNAAADMLRDRAAKVEKNLGTIERAWRGVRDLAKEAWDAMLNVGRPDSSADQLSKAGERVAYLEKQVEGRRSRGLATGDLDGQLAAAKALHDTLRETARLDERAAGIKADLAAKDKARIELAQALEQSASKQEKMAIAIAQANALADRAGASAAERAQLVNAALEKYAEKESKATKAALTDYDKLMQRLGVEVPKAAAEAEAAQQGYNKSQTEFLALAGSPAWAKFTNDQRATVAALFEKKIASEQATAATKAEEKATVEAVKAREKALATGEKELEKLRASVIAQQEQNARLGLTKEAIAELDAAKLEMLATDLELQAIKAMDRNLDEAQYELLKRQAQAYRDLAQAKRDGAAKQAAIDSEKELEKSAKKAAKEGERAAEHIERSLTDSLMRGFESGKDMARSLRDSVVAMFKTMVLRPVVSAIVSPVAGAITGAMGFGGGGQSAAASMAGSMGTSFLGSALGGIGAFGTGASYGAASLFANGLGTTLTAGTQMIGAGSVMSGLGTIAGALGPIAIGIALLSSLIKKSTPHMGGGSSYSAAEGLRTGKDQYTTANYGFADTRTYDATAGKLTADLAKSVVTILDSTAKTFGQEAGYAVSTAFADDKSKDGAWGALVIQQMGKTVLNWQDGQDNKWAPKVFADGEAGSKEYLTEIAKSARDELTRVLKDSAWATTMLEALGDSPALEGLAATVEQINAAKLAFVQFGKLMPQFADLSQKALSKMAETVGGAGNLVRAMEVFSRDYFTEEERIAVVRADLTAEFGKLGFTLPKTRDELKALIQAQWAMGEGGAETAGKLLQLTEAYASITQSVEETFKVRLDSAYSMAERAASVERAYWERQADIHRDAAASIRAVFETLAGSLTDLYGQVDATREMRAAEGERYLVQAQLAARAGQLPDAKDLGTAIDAVRSGIEGRVYTSEKERDFDRLVLAGRMAEVKDVAGDQLTIEEQALDIAERQLERIDQELENWKRLIDEATGTKAGVLSMAEAGQAILALLQEQQAAAEEAKNPEGSKPAGGGFSSGPGGAPASAPAGAGAASTGRSEQIRNAVAWAEHNGELDLREVAITASILGLTQADFAKEFGYSLEDVQKAFEGQGVQRFASGAAFRNGVVTRPTRFSIGEMGEDGHEGILPLANVGGRLGVHAVGMGGSQQQSNAELVAQIQVLNTRIEQIQASSAKTADVLSQFTRNGTGPARVLLVNANG